MLHMPVHLKCFKNGEKLIIMIVTKHPTLMTPLCFRNVNEDTKTDIMETSMPHTRQSTIHFY
jgi:hypothetical protein